MLKQPLRSAVLILLLATGGAGASPVPDYPFVHVTGISYQVPMPDIASLDFEIFAPDADPPPGGGWVGDVRGCPQGGAGR